ncbi:hypothetical protein LA080_003471 [Diaporthe eres]|nr:hypothetical protein LA080_003471 [Diaporthe eres]
MPIILEVLSRTQENRVYSHFAMTLRGRHAHTYWLRSKGPIWYSSTACLSTNYGARPVNCDIVGYKRALTGLLYLFLCPSVPLHPRGPPEDGQPRAGKARHSTLHEQMGTPFGLGGIKNVRRLCARPLMKRPHPQAEKWPRREALSLGRRARAERMLDMSHAAPTISVISPIPRHASSRGTRAWKYHASR